MNDTVNDNDNGVMMPSPGDYEAQGLDEANKTRRSKVGLQKIIGDGEIYQK